ncbi:hypothetical protein KUTeg_017173 [Tegillarca granosa]|uniref:BTB domain-containing protein n=1 Tax=Tegillarca granosa TaxID=220873 RepID=A0ABQ9ETJ6_TEGGR|nr:hypothetical protein KUTeg_017173 [Tegillarca granosa]
MDIITINVGGTIFETSKTTLQRFPNTKLGQLQETDESYNKKKEQYFFDRNPQYFNSILDLYRTGSLHLPEVACGASLKEELEFWNVSNDIISDCCLQTYFKHGNTIEVINDIKKKFESPWIDYDETRCENSTWCRVRRKVWLVMDQPTSSTLAKVYTLLFLSVVLISSITFCFGTLESLRVKFVTEAQLSRILNSSYIPPAWRTVNFNNPKEKLYATSKILPALYYIELISGTFFSLELVLHFAFCPRKSRFFRSALNVLDLVLFVDIWVSFGMEQHGDVIFGSVSTTYLYIAVKSLTILRLFRFFRLVKLYTGLRILFMALYASLRELVLLLIVFLISCLFFASFIFYAEFHESTTFPNMLIGLWWAIVTMTTLGYGDHYPKSPPGYVVGTICSICGILILAMPIAIVANNFNNYYMRNKEREQLINENILKSRSSVSPMIVKPVFQKDVEICNSKSM